MIPAPTVAFPASEIRLTLSGRDVWKSMDVNQECFGNAITLRPGTREGGTLHKIATLLTHINAVVGRSAVYPVLCVAY